MRYQVTITETLSRIKSIEAPSALLAEEEVRRLYKKESIVLDYSDLQDVQFKLSLPLFFKSTDRAFTLLHGDCRDLLQQFRFINRERG